MSDTLDALPEAGNPSEDEIESAFATETAASLERIAAFLQEAAAFEIGAAARAGNGPGSDPTLMAASRLRASSPG